LTVTLLDGGMGQELIRRSRNRPSPIWSAQVMMTEPDLVRSVHADFIAAGADVLTVNAYAATPQRLAGVGAGHLFDALQQAALETAQAARDASDRAETIRLAGCLPPLVASYHPDHAPDAAVSRDSWRRIVAAQVDGVDLFLCETMASVAEAQVATAAAAESGLPVWTAMTVNDDDGTRLRSGEPLEAVSPLVDEFRPDCLLLNCSTPEAISDGLPILARLGEVFGAYANGFTAISAAFDRIGATVDLLETRHDLDPASYAVFAVRWTSLGATIAGGCCEVGPAHIAELARRLKSFRGPSTGE
jgi:S-methylmethionine-dependent homocysteine/selenocysteine methylase